MGQLLSLISSQHYDEVELNFEGEPKPEPSEEKTYSDVEEVLSKAAGIQASIEGYTGCQELARKAMTTPSHENEQEAFEGLLTAVDSISSFFLYCKELEKVFPKLLAALSKPPVDRQNPTIDHALALQLATLFAFALEFDRVRMERPNLSNDFSYYRRLLPKFNKHPDIRIKDDEASGMALFTAEHIPMINCLSKSAARAHEKNVHIGTVLAVLANSCIKALKSKKFAAEPKLVATCSRAMTAAIVIYDQIETTSVFHKKSPIQVKQAILLLKKDFPKEVTLLSAIRYSTKHFNDAPQSIQDMFD